MIPVNYRAHCTGPKIDFRHVQIRELGYAEGKNFVLDHRYGEGRPDLLDEHARELVGLKMGVIVAATDSAVAAVAQHTKAIPIVMANSTDPVGTGLVASLAHTGGNVTGVTSVNPSLSAKLLELLGEVVPRLSRLALFWNPDSSGTVLNFKEVERAAGALGLNLQSIEVRRSENVERAFLTHGQNGLPENCHQDDVAWVNVNDRMHVRALTIDAGVNLYLGTLG